MAELTNALVAEWDHIPAANFHNLVKAFKEGWRLLQQHINARLLIGLCHIMYLVSCRKVLVKKGELPDSFITRQKLVASGNNPNLLQHSATACLKIILS